MFTMKFKLDSAQVFIPDGTGSEEALARTTHMAFGAHPDDIEILAVDGILECFQRRDKWFTGVVVTNGSGAPRDNLYKDYTDEEMRAVRIVEQNKAAHIGEYAAVVLLDYPSSAVKDGLNQDPVDDIAHLIEKAGPGIIYTHNLADKHDTHVAVALRVIQAIRSVPKENHPQKLYGCEVWRNLDWMVNSDKVVFDASSHEALQAALLAVFDSQISGGKRYDLATMGSRRANATYSASHASDISSGMVFAMDLTPLIEDPLLDPRSYVQGYINRLTNDVSDRIARMS